MTSTKTARMPKTGFPTASKVLMKYEKQRAYRQHRQKMQDMRHGIDNSNPQQYPHLEVRMKRLQKEEERQMIIDHENEILVNKMRKIMTRKGRLDNWNDYEQKSLHTPYRERQLEQIAVENHGIAKRLERVGPVYHVKSWEDDFHRHEEILERRAEETKDYDDVLTPRRQKRLSKTRQQRKAKKVVPDEDKYEDDFESDNDSIDVKDKENADKDSMTKKDRTDSSQERQEEEQKAKLPRIECRKKDKDSTKDKGTSKVSRLPAVGQTRKESMEDKFAVYRDRKYEAKLKLIKAQQKKAHENRTSSSTVKSKESFSEETESSTCSARKDSRTSESTAVRGDNYQTSKNPVEDPETGEYGQAESANPDAAMSESSKSETTKSGSNFVKNGDGSGHNFSSEPNSFDKNSSSKEKESDTPEDQLREGEPSKNKPSPVEHTEDKPSPVEQSEDKPLLGEQTKDKLSAGEQTENKPSGVDGKRNEPTDLMSSNSAESSADSHSSGGDERVGSVGNTSTTTSQSVGRTSARESQRSVQSIQNNRAEDAISVFSQSEGGTTLAESDAKQLFRICKELDKLEDVFIRTLVRRSYQQRMQTKSKFRDLYDLDLMLELRQGLGEPWVPLINALLTEKEASDVSSVHNALQNKDISSLVEILCTRNTNSINNLKEAYRKEYAISLESDISEKTKNPVQLLLLTLLKGGRMESSDVNEDEAEKDARELFESGEGRWTSDTGKFMKLVEQKNSAQFKTILNMFKQISGGKDILVSVRHDCHDTGDYVEAVSTLINCSKGPQMYFCEKLHACKKLDDPSFVNILVSRAETDMPATRKVYKKRYGKELSEDIASRGPHLTLKVLQELVNRPAPGQNSKAKTQGTRKPTGNQQTGQVKKPAVRKPEKRDEAAAVKSNPLNQPGKRVLAEAKHKREQEEKAKAKQTVQKREKSKVEKPSESDCDGTVLPAKDFNAERDADKLLKAMDGLGTNQDDITQILPRRSNSQRQAIKAAYSKKYDRDLVEDLKSELSGDFEELILALMMTPVEYESYCLNDAVRGLGTDEAGLLGMLLTRTPKEIKAVKDQYQQAYKKTLVEDLAADSSNAFKQMILQLVKAERDESRAVDQTKAEEDARKLFKEDTKSLCVTEGTLVDLLTQQNKAQIKATFDKYTEIAGHDVYEGIKLAMLGEDEEGYIGLVRASEDVVGFYATRLNQCMIRDVGADDKMIIRIIVTRSEIDLANIKVRFHELYGKALGEVVEKECGGDFKKTLLVVLGEKQFSARSGRKPQSGQERTSAKDSFAAETTFPLLEDSSGSSNNRTDAGNISYTDKKQDKTATDKTWDSVDSAVEKISCTPDKVDSAEKQRDQTDTHNTENKMDSTRDEIGRKLDKMNSRQNLKDETQDKVNSAQRVVGSAQNIMDTDRKQDKIDIDSKTDGQDTDSADKQELSRVEKANRVENDNVLKVEKPKTPPESEIGLEKQRKIGLPDKQDSDSKIIKASKTNTKVSVVPKTEQSLETFDPGRDCEYLFSLLNGQETDHNKIFNLLINRTHRQRLQLRMKYELLYRRDLVRELRNCLSPSQEIVLGALTLEMVEYDALCIHQAVSGIAIDDKTLVNILISRDPVHLKAVKIKFWQVYGKDLIDYLRRVTNTELGELLLVFSCLREAKSPRRQSEEHVTEAAQRLAKKLSSGEKSYLDVFHKKSGDDIHKIFRKYSEITGKDVSESFHKYKSGEVKFALLAFADYLNDHTLFYVHQLRAAMKDPGVDGIILIHIIVSRAEVDLGEIKSLYVTEYGVALEEDLRQNCKADYAQVLLAILRATK